MFCQRFSGKRLYVKICEKSDIALGHIFEILSPTELKQTLNIEESFNGTIYTQKGFTIEESLPESSEEIENALNKGLRKLKDRGKFVSKGEPVNIILKSEKDEDNRELTAAEKKFLFKQSIKEIAEEAKEEAKLEEAIQKDLNVRTSDPVGHGGAGVIPLSSAKTRSENYDSYEEMIDDLTVKRNSGDKQADLILAKLTHKTFRGRKQQPIAMYYEFRGEVDPVTGKEKGIVELMNERYRKQVLLEGKNRED